MRRYLVAGLCGAAVVVALAVGAFLLTDLQVSENSGVPDVVGQPVSQARAELEGAGFDVRVTEPGPAEASHPIVHTQVPASGDEAPGDAVVTIEVGVDYGAVFSGG